MTFIGHNLQVAEKFGGPPETRTPDPLIKSLARVQLQPSRVYSNQETNEFTSARFVAACTGHPDTIQPHLPFSSDLTSDVPLKRLALLTTCNLVADLCPGPDQSKFVNLSPRGRHAIKAKQAIPTLQKPLSCLLWPRHRCERTES